MYKNVFPPLGRQFPEQNRDADPRFPTEKMNKGIFQNFIFYIAALKKLVIFLTVLD
jgi:hypothetical protein